MSGVPVVQLGEVTTKVGSGATPRGGEAAYKSSGTPLIRSMNVHFDGFRREGLAFLDEDQARALKNVEVRAGDLLLNITGASIGRVTVAPAAMDGARVNQHVCIIRPDQRLDGSFLRWYLASPSQQRLINGIESGATRQALTKEKILGFEVPLLPLPQQRAVVAEIEKQFSRLDEAVANLKRVKANLNRYRDQVLNAAIAGRLSIGDVAAKANAGKSASGHLERALRLRRETWKGRGRYREPTSPRAASPVEAPDGWVLSTVEQLAWVDVGFAFRSAEFAESGIRLLRGENIEPGSLRWEDVRHWSPERLAGFEHLLLEEGQIVLAMDRPIISSGLKLARVKASDLPCLLVQRMARLRCVDRSVEPYLTIAMSTERFRRHLLGGQTGTQLPHVSGATIASFVVPLPPPDEQRRIAAEVDRRLSIVREVEAEVDANLMRAHSLRQAVLANSFHAN